MFWDDASEKETEVGAAARVLVMRVVVRKKETEVGAAARELVTRGV